MIKDFRAVYSPPQVERLYVTRPLRLLASASLDATIEELEDGGEF